MGGHGGLNILPQKRWNVYNFDNREKVRKDEEAAAKEEQLKREQSRKRDAEFRLQQLRQFRGLPSSNQPQSSSSGLQAESKSNNNHINLFEGIRVFDPVSGKEDDVDDKRKGFRKKMKKEAEAPKVVLPEDEKYRLGYGLVGKGVKLPWYMEKKPINDDDDDNEDDDVLKEGNKSSSSSGKKTLEELREERLKREKREKERERVFLLEKQRRDGVVPMDRGYSRRYT